MTTRFQEHTGRRPAPPYTGLSPPAVLADRPLCLRRLTSSEQTALAPFPPEGENCVSLRCSSSPHKVYRLCGVPHRCFNARTETGQAYHYTDMRVIASRLATACCARTAALPIPPFLWWGHGLLNPARLPFRTAYQTYPVDLFNYRTVASPHRRAMCWCVCADWRLCRNTSQFETH